MSRDPSRGFSWWRENKLFQVNAHLPVQTPCPGKFCLPSNFVSKVSFMPRKISRSLGVSRVMKNTSDLLRKRSFRDLGVILHVINAFYMACSDKQYLFREQTLGKSCVIDATNFSQNAMSQNEVFSKISRDPSRGFSW